MIKTVISKFFYLLTKKFNYRVENAIKHIANDKNCSGATRKRCDGARLRQIVEKQHLVKRAPIDSNFTSYSSQASLDSNTSSTNS